MKAFDARFVPARPKRCKKWHKMVVLRMSLDGVRRQRTIPDQIFGPMLDQGCVDPVRELAHPERLRCPEPGSIHKPQIVREAARAQHQDFVPQSGQRIAQAHVMRRTEVALDTELYDGNIVLRIHHEKRHPGAVVEPPVVTVEARHPAAASAPVTRVASAADPGAGYWRR